MEILIVLVGLTMGCLPCICCCIPCARKAMLKCCAEICSDVFVACCNPCFKFCGIDLKAEQKAQKEAEVVQSSQLQASNTSTQVLVIEHANNLHNPEETALHGTHNEYN